MKKLYEFDCERKVIVCYHPKDDYEVDIRRVYSVCKDTWKSSSHHIKFPMAFDGAFKLNEGWAFEFQWHPREGDLDDLLNWNHLGGNYE